MRRPTRAERQNEVAFCSEVSKWSDAFFDSTPHLPFHNSKIEQYATGSNKRADLRFYDKTGDLLLCGEVKLPGTNDGQSAFNPAVMNDAYNKATAENCRYFFTWNVEELALFDRSRWDAHTMHDRCVQTWQFENRLNDSSDVTRELVIQKLRDRFLPNFFTDFAEILAGTKKGFDRKPAEFYLAVLESYLLGPRAPVRELRNHIEVQFDQSPEFKERFNKWVIKEQNWNFDPNDEDSRLEIYQRAAESICYVLNNRILFYQAISLRNELPKLDIPARFQKSASLALKHLTDCFEIAVHKTSDYESIFLPEKGSDDWSTVTALSGTNSIQAWDNVIRWVEGINFKEIPTDILGKTFQKLISPEERHRFGQHYTHETIVELINAFCIRKGNDIVLDPACGSGSFLVRAYYRKHQLDKSLSHQHLLEGIYGADINPYPAHLATLNLAARQIANEENYPRVAHKNFFKITRTGTFCELPVMKSAYDGNRGRKSIVLPEINAIIGNPPYVRQEKIPKKKDKGAVADQTKEYIGKVAENAYQGIQLSMQSDLHIYFWPVAARFLAEKGMFGFLTSSSWLDAKYGFALQRWILSHFKLIAIIESVNEPWFEDARVKTCATIMERCDDAGKRDENPVRFVHLKRPLTEILGEEYWEEIEDNDGREELRKESAEKLRDLIKSKKKDYSDSNMRVLVKQQSDLWTEGLSVAQMFARQKTLSKDAFVETPDDEVEVDSEEIELDSDPEENLLLDYGGGKWGRYLRAPEFYFDIMREFGSKFVRLGDIALIRFGIKSGCDAFFMPRDVSDKLLARHKTESEWRLLPISRRTKRSQVENGSIRIIQAGDKSLHPVESVFLRPEIHSPMQLDKPVVTEADTDRVVLWVSNSLEEIEGTHAHAFIRWGSRHTFSSKKSAAVPVPKRPTCASRDIWYDLTGLKPGIGFWTKAQKYRHIVPYNPNRVSCNCNLYDLHAVGLSSEAEKALVPLLNSTLVGLMKHFYGRYAGAEGTLKMEIVDSLMLEVPSPEGVSQVLADRMERSLMRISERDVTHLIEEDFRLCTDPAEMRVLEGKPIGLPLELQREDRRELDLLVFELLGVTSSERREKLVDQLYYETTKYYRAQRIQDIQASANRSGGNRRGVSANSLAMGAWQLLDSDFKKPLKEWLDENVSKGKSVILPDGEARLVSAENMYDNTTIYFGKGSTANIIAESRAEAELIETVAHTGLRGSLTIPESETTARQLLGELSKRLLSANIKFTELSEQYASDENTQQQVKNLLKKWFIHGKFD